MDFTSPELRERIQNLKQQFEKVGTAPAASHNSTNGTSLFSQNEFNLAQRYFCIRLAVIENLFKAMETSLDQISICFEVSKAMFFYQDAIVNNPEFWQEEQGVNQMLCSNNFKMAKADIQEAGDRLNYEVGFLQAGQYTNQDTVLQTLEHVEKYQKLVGRFHEYVGVLTEMDGRREAALAPFDPDQKPEIGDTNPESYLKGIHRKSSQNAESAMMYNADLADSYFAVIDFMKVNGFSEADIQPAEGALGLVLYRFEPLEDARDNRYGFTQIRFG